MDREALKGDRHRVRDGAADVLEQLAGDATKASQKKPAASAAIGRAKNRSGNDIGNPRVGAKRLPFGRWQTDQAPAPVMYSVFARLLRLPT